MTNKEFMIKLLKAQVKPLNLNEICSCVPKIPRDNVKEMLEYLTDINMIHCNLGAGIMFPRTFEAK